MHDYEENARKYVESQFEIFNGIAFSLEAAGLSEGGSALDPVNVEGQIAIHNAAERLYGALIFYREVFGEKSEFVEFEQAHFSDDSFNGSVRSVCRQLGEAREALQELIEERSSGDKKV
jgi:hypothetical protein